MYSFQNLKGEKKYMAESQKSNQAHILETKTIKPTKTIILDSLHKLEFCKIRF